MSKERKPLVIDLATIKPPQTWPVHLEFIPVRKIARGACDHVYGYDYCGNEYDASGLDELDEALYERYIGLVDNRLESILHRDSMPSNWKKRHQEADHVYRKAMDDAEEAWLAANRETRAHAGDGILCQVCPKCGTKLT